MSELIFHILNLPPMPRNRSHQPIKSMLVKSKLAKEFEKDLTQRLSEFEHDFLDFKQLFTRSADGGSAHYIRGVYTIFTPRELLFTQEGNISQRAVDTDAHKVMRDTIYSCLGIDDKFERRTEFFTPVSPDGNWNYIISFKVCPVNELENVLCPKRNTLSSMVSSTELEKNDLISSASQFL